jgi:hypothetical protein
VLCESLSRWRSRVRRSRLEGSGQRQDGRHGAVKRLSPTEHLVQADAERMHVGRGTDLVDLALNLLRSHVRGAAQNHAMLSDFRFAWLLAACQSKVHQNGLTVFVDHDVCMHTALLDGSQPSETT